MNTLSPRSPKRRQHTPLMWASGGTLLLHGAFLLTLWLWPHPATKPREALLEVDLAQNNPPKATPLPTVQPTEVPRATPKPRALINPQLARQTRHMNLDVPPPRPKPQQYAVKTPILAPTMVPLVKKKLEAASTIPIQKTTTHRESAKPKSALRPMHSTVPSSSSKTTNASSGSTSQRRFARVDERDTNLGFERGERAETPSGANAGSNARGQREETAGTEAGLELPRTRARHGRSTALDAPSGSAPTTSKDGTEVEIGPSPTRGGRRRATLGLGDGEEEQGALHGGGLGNAKGLRNIGNAQMGRGEDEAAGEGVSNGRRGYGARGNARSGRTGSRLAGDPFGSSGGNSDVGKGDGDGAGRGPQSGTRLARHGLGEGDLDGDAQFGRGTGRVTGEGAGAGRGGEQGRGRGDDEETDGIGSGGRRGRSGAGRGAHRASDMEDQIGRGIWGGFKMRFYQDKAAHPDLPDATFHPGNPIDWPVFTRLVTQKTVPNLDFDWGETPPTPTMKSTFWSLKADGRIFVPKDDTYEFFFDELDDAGSLVLDGETIIKIWKVQKSSPSSAKMFLKRGPHDIQIQYVQGPATAASIKLSWRSTSFPKETVGVYRAPENE